MITSYIEKQLGRAQYKILEDKTYFGEIPGLRGVWASSKTLERCREELREVLEEWLAFKLSSGERVTGFQIRNVAHMAEVAR